MPARKNGLKRLCYAVVLVLLSLAIGQLASALPALEGLEISGTVFFDKNGNGARDAADTGIEGAVLQLRDTATGGSAYSAAASSGADGVYRFIGVPAGAYTLVQTPPEAYTTTSAASVNLVLTDASLTADFGDTLILYVTGAEFQDLNHDGARAPGEPGVAGTLVRIYHDANDQRPGGSG